MDKKINITFNKHEIHVTSNPMTDEYFLLGIAKAYILASQDYGTNPIAFLEALLKEEEEE